MKKLLSIVLLCFMLNGFIAGCTEQQMQQVDKFAKTGIEITESGEGILDSPVVGALIPAPIKAGVRLGGEIFVLLAGAWLAWRTKQTKTALTEVVAGNEAVKKKMDGKTKEVFSLAHEAAQDVNTTTKMVAKIRKNLKV